MASSPPSNPDYNIDLPIQGYDYKWNCAVCLIPAKSGVALEFQFLEFTHSCVYFDFDENWTPWVGYICCNHKFHFHCITKGVTVEGFNLIAPYCCPHH